MNTTKTIMTNFEEIGLRIMNGPTGVVPRLPNKSKMADSGHKTLMRKMLISAYWMKIFAKKCSTTMQHDHAEIST